MLTMFVRSAILYLVVIAILRIMGKRQIGQMQPYELVITLMVADFAASPLDGVSTPLLNGLMPIAALVFTNCLISIIIYKSQKAKNFINGKPIILVHNGRINRTELDKQAYTLSDLLEQTRLSGFSDIGDIGLALLEPSGQMSVFPISQKRNVETQDIGVETGYETMPLILILDGKVQRENLRHDPVNSLWLEGQLASLSLKPKDILFMSVSCKGVLQIQLQKKGAPLIYKRVLEPKAVSW